MTEYAIHVYYEVYNKMKKLTTQEFITKAKAIHGDKYDYSKVNYTGTENKVIIICKIHKDFLIKPHNFLQGQGCPKCSSHQFITEESFISRAKEIHGNRYDYSKVNYKKASEPVCIICPIHGEFFQKPSVHLSGCGCPKCFATPKLTTEEFIKKAKTIYGNKYDYSKVEYKGNKIKICVICPTHGEWLVTPNNFLRGSECPKCYGTPKLTTSEFLKRARKINGDKYDYSKVVYDGNKKKIKIICPVHGEFLQSPASHLKGTGCPACSGREKITRELFFKQSKLNHTTTYDYTKVDFKDTNEKVCIICPIHGEFWQTVSYHMHGGNCPKCAGGVRLSKAEFIKKAQAIHGDKYDYSKVIYENYNTKVQIICKEHGAFLQTPNNHLFGAGCPTCPQSNLEGELRQFLVKNKIYFEQEKTFSWLKYKKKMFLDFYLPDYNIAIECQGGQHFAPIDLFGGEEFFNKTLLRDDIKNKLCTEHGIKILYFSNAHVDYPYKVLESYNELLNEIKK